MPVSFFKSHKVMAGEFEADVVFESSGTTRTINSKHFVKDIELYRQSFIKGFERFYSNISEWCIIGLLPSYLERNGSSLVMMVDELITQSNHNESGFYLYEFEKLAFVLQQLESRQQKNFIDWGNFCIA